MICVTRVHGVTVMTVGLGKLHWQRVLYSHLHDKQVGQEIVW